MSNLEKNIRYKRPQVTLKWASLKEGDVLVDQQEQEHTIQERTPDHLYTDTKLDINDERLLRGWTQK